MIPAPLTPHELKTVLWLDEHSLFLGTGQQICQVLLDLLLLHFPPTSKSALQHMIIDQTFPTGPVLGFLSCLCLLVVWMVVLQQPSAVIFVTL